MSNEQYQMLTSVLTLVGLLFACVQLWQIRSNRKKQFDQARREKTVEMVIHYVKSVSRETKISETIVSKFTDEQCLDLYNLNPFPVNESIKRRICEICPYKESCNKKIAEKKICQGSDGKFYVKDDILYFLRDQAITRLNNLEIVLLAWQLGIVEQEIIEEQFLFLDKKREKERALEVFRSIAGGGQSYPAIERFYQNLDKRKLDKAKKALKKVIK